MCGWCSWPEFRRAPCVVAYLTAGGCQCGLQTLCSGMSPATTRAKQQPPTPVRAVPAFWVPGVWQRKRSLLCHLFFVTVRVGETFKSWGLTEIPELGLFSHLLLFNEGRLGKLHLSSKNATFLYYAKTCEPRTGKGMPLYPLLWSIKLGTYTETMQGGKTATIFHRSFSVCFCHC